VRRVLMALGDEQGFGQQMLENYKWDHQIKPKALGMLQTQLQKLPEKFTHW
jgi:hypothetical protein